MAKLRLIASTYSFSNTSYMSIQNAANMYHDTDNTSYATVTHTQKATTAHYIYIKGFNFSAIPSDAVVNSFTVKFKAKESDLSTSAVYGPKECNGTTALVVDCSGVVTTSEQILTFYNKGSFDVIKSFGSDFGIRLSVRRNNKNTQGYLYIYGAEIEVDYTIPTPVTEQLKVKVNGAWQNVSAVYKKVNGAWVEQSDLSTLFSTEANYVKGDV